MILQGQEHTLQRGGLMGERSYGIALTPKMYSMMSDRLYTDRIGSVVREVCSNAWDAQKMRSIATGEPITPFKVTLPTDLEPHFVVEDTGPGMPDAVAQDLYSTLGLSTKENTNDQIGAFGLGSKSPFAVSDTFTVENTHEGVTHFYLCFKSERGMPSLLKTGERNEGRANGVKVVIPAPGYRYSEYKQALMRQLIVMEPKPIINNLEAFDFIEPVIAVRNEYGYILGNCRDFNLSARSVYARMGMVLYPVDMGQLRLPSTIEHRFGTSTALVLEFPIGALEPLPSREGLTYDDITKANIAEVYNKFIADYRGRLKKLIESQPSPLEAYREMKKIKDTTGVDFTYDGVWCLGMEISQRGVSNVFPTFEHEWEEDVTQWVQKPIDKDHEQYDPTLSDEDQLQQTVPTVVKVKKKGRFPVFYAEKFDKHDLRLTKKRRSIGFDHLDFLTLERILDGSDVYLFVDELEPKYRIPRMKTWLNQLHWQKNGYVVRVDPRYSGSKTDFTEFFASIDRIQRGFIAQAKTDQPDAFTLFTSVARPEKDEQEAKVKQTTVPGLSIVKRGYTRDRYFKWAELEAWMSTEDEDGNEIENTLIDNIFYVKAFRKDLPDYGFTTKEFALKVSLLNAAFIVVGKSGENHIPKLEAMGIPEFKGWVEKRMAGFTPDEIYRKHNSAKRLIQNHSNLYNWSLIDTFPMIRDLLKEQDEVVHPFFDVWQEVRDTTAEDISKAFNGNEYKIINTLRTSQMLDLFKDQPWYANLEIDLVDNFEKQFAHFRSTYPLFLVVSERCRYHDDAKDQLIQYMKDYNRLHDMGSVIDYTQVLESEII